MKIAIISDIHEDVESLKQALHLIEKEKCDEIFFLGDSVGFSNQFYDFEATKNANECIDLIRTNCKLSVAGNHDIYLTQRFPEIFIQNNLPKNWYELSYTEQLVLSRDKFWLYQEEDDPQLSDENFNFLKELPEYKIMKIDNINYLFSHFIYPDISGNTKANLILKKDYYEHFDFMANNDCLISFTAHRHIPGYLSIFRNKISYKDFGTKKLKNKSQIINCPAVVSSSRKSGFVIFDTINFELFVINL